MRVFHCDGFTYPLPPGHRFPAAKYTLLRERVAAELTPPCELQTPAAATDAQLLRVHRPEYLTAVKDGSLSPREVRRIGLPWSPELVERARRSVGGTIEACRAALLDGIAVSLSGGTHHAFPDHGEGFCVFNDCAVACRAMQAEGRARRIVIIDCDVHQGNGTAVIFRDEPGVFTFSIHQENLYPPKRQSTLDIGLENRAGDGEYLSRLRKSLPAILEFFSPDLVIYVAGADPYEKDRIGGLGLTMEGLRQRDELVLGGCFQKRVPVLTVLAGGYAAEFSDTVGIHLHTALSARQLWG